MFNKGLKNEAIATYESSLKSHEFAMKRIVTRSEILHKEKVFLKKQIDAVWNYLNDMRNKPEEFDLVVKEIQIQFKKFETMVHSIENELDTTLKKTAGMGAAGAAAGAGIAAFGPSAAMAVATTFGTASTGTAISALSGAAATNAALAWLGGGALVAGGGGTAAGSAFLALAGPVGWAIGGGAVLTAGLFASSKNKKAAEDAYSKARDIREHTDLLVATTSEIVKSSSLVAKTNSELNTLYIRAL